MRNVTPFGAVWRIGGSGNQIDRLLEQWDKTPPAVLVVLNNSKRALDLADRWPETLVYYRIKENGYTPRNDDFAIYHPVQSVFDQFADYISEARYRGLKNAGIYAANEPRFLDSIGWCLDMAKLCVRAEVPVVLGNWTVGTPEPSDYSQAHVLFEYAANNRRYVTLGVHEYFVTDPLEAITHDFGPENSPRNSDLPWVGWLVGRYRFINHYCRNNDIEPPNIAVTEFAVGGEIDKEEGFARSRSGPIRVYKRMPFDMHSSAHYQYIYEMYTKAVEEVYASDDNVLGLCLFALGWGGDLNSSNWDHGLLGPVFPRLAAKTWVDIRQANKPSPAEQPVEPPSEKPIKPTPEPDETINVIIQFQGKTWRGVLSPVDAKG
jgi:hypothetical protein